MSGAAGEQQTRPALPALVLVHGFGTSARVWDAVLPHLPGRDELTLFTPDLPGFGTAAAESADTGEGFTVDEMADALERAIAAEGLTRYLLAGHSMGGKVATVLAARQAGGQGEGPCGLFLLAPSPPSPEPMTAEGRASLRAAHGDVEALDKHYHELEHTPLPEDARRQLIADGLRASAAGWAAWPDAGSKEHREADARALQDSGLPVWVVTSPQDTVITPQVLDGQLRPAFPQAQYSEIAGSGHLLPVEQPRAVAQALLVALRACPE